MTAADAAHARARARVIVVNETWRLCPSADVLYAADWSWWQTRAPAPEAFPGERWTTPTAWPKKLHSLLATLHTVETVPGDRILDAPPFHHGYNSSFQAMQLARYWGAHRIVFLGLDMKHAGTLTHWHDNHERPLANSPVALGLFAKAFTKAAPQMAAKGVEVINASRQTALTCFPRVPLEEVLP